MTDQNFQVDLSGMILLLSDHLYRSPDVFARELLQNAVDSISARKLVDAKFEGEVVFEVVTGGEDKRTIIVTDNGIGLSTQEVREFLSTIGKSSKSGVADRSQFIGQFGIGLLSGFLVSDEITVITQSIRLENPTVEWKGRADGTFTIRELETQLTVGTRVHLNAKPGTLDFFESAKVERMLKHYGCHLPYEITLTYGSRTNSINETPPWQTTTTSNDSVSELYLEYGRSVFDMDFLDAVPLQSIKGGVRGVAFILPQAASPATKQSHRVYLKNMLLSEKVEGLLPDWAFFVRCVINSDKLRPNAARDEFFEDEILRLTRKELGRCLQDYLVGLAKTDRDKLNRLIALHYLPIKALAADDDEFFDVIINWLPFETSLGPTTLNDYRGGIRYLNTVEQFQQISRIAHAQDVCVFNGGFAYDIQLLEKLGRRSPDRNVECLPVDEFVEEFVELNESEANRIASFKAIAEGVLKNFKCRPEFRKFAPADLPALFTTNESASFLRATDDIKEKLADHWGETLDGLVDGSDSANFSQLVFNFRNPLVRKVISIESRLVLEKIVELLYLQAILLGQYPLQKNEKKILGSGLLGLIDLLKD